MVTGKRIKAEIAHLGTNPISGAANDTTANWAELGSGIAWYKTSGLLIDQPSQYGILLNLVGIDLDVAQLWLPQASGNVFRRGGNSAGWDGSWRKLYDSVGDAYLSTIGTVYNFTSKSSMSLEANQDSRLAAQKLNAITLPAGVYAIQVVGVYGSASSTPSHCEVGILNASNTILGRIRVANADSYWSQLNYMGVHQFTNPTAVSPIMTCSVARTGCALYASAIRIR